MAEEPVRRRLAAILAADVAGYSRLMGNDEEGTLAALTAHRTELIEPCIAGHQGRLVKTTGDGLLVEFASVVDAVRCAVAFQEGMRQRNADTAEDRRIAFRIGVNLGDVMVQDDDVFGDGVNVAARLEGLAAPGDIYISGDVYRQVEGKVDLGFEDLGAQRVKNIEKPVHAYRVMREGGTGLKRSDSAAEGPAVAAPDRTSIAVLPFENMSADPEQEYFSDGITEDIITDLSKISGLFVIARNSSFAYKGRPVNVGQVARDLGVGYVLEGSVRKAGGRVRITAQLIDGAGDSHIWAERYDGALDDIFALQDQVSREIVRALDIRLTGQDEDQVATTGGHNVEAYEHLLRARQYHFRFTQQANEAAQAELEKALKTDPDYAEAIALKAECHLQVWNQSWSDDRQATLDHASDFARRAVAVNSELPEGHVALAHVLLWQRENDEAVAEIDRAIELNPNSARTRGLRSMILAWSGRPEDAIADAKEAIRLDPNGPALYHWNLGIAQYHSDRFGDAEGNLRKSALLNPDFMPVHFYIAANHIHIGKNEEARRAFAEVVRLNPEMSVQTVKFYIPISDPKVLARLIDDLREAGLPE